METEVNNPEPQVPPRISRETVNRVGVGLLVIYALVLTVLAADQVFHLGIWKPQLDRRIERNLDQLVALAGETNLTAQKRQQAETLAEEIVNFHEFSVPILLDAMSSGDPKRRSIARQCLSQIGQRFFGLSPQAAAQMSSSTRAWRGWWQGVREKLDELARKSSPQP